MEQRISRVNLITVALLALLVLTTVPPAILRQRERSRAETCSDQLRDLGVRFLLHGERDSRKRYCSGAFDLARDGCPDVVGWLASVRLGDDKPEINSICPSNPAVGSETLNQLLGYQQGKDQPLQQTMAGVTEADFANSFCQSFALTLSTGQALATDNALQPSALPRIAVVQEAVKQGYNTNYATSWFLARQVHRFTKGDSSGDEGPRVFCLGNQRDQSGAYDGLSVRYAEKADVPTSSIPLLGDAALAHPVAAVLLEALSPSLLAGSRLAISSGNGPGTLERNLTMSYVSDLAQVDQPEGNDIKSLIHDDTLPLPDEEGLGGVDLDSNGQTDPLSNPTAYGGNDGRLFLQDTRMWSSVHGSGNRRELNVLFADGGVKTLHDVNSDGWLNPGFAVDSSLPEEERSRLAGYTNVRCEAGPDACFSGPYLSQAFLPFRCVE